MAAKKKRDTSRNRSLRVHLEVLQNGATLIARTERFRRHGSLWLTSRPGKPLSLPFYPLPNQRHEFLRFEKGQAVLIAAHKWEGFCTSRGELVHISRSDKGRREIPMQRGDYASIMLDDLRIMVKIAPATRAGRSTQDRHRTGIGSGYRGSFVRHFLPSVAEQRAFLAAALMVAVIGGGFLFGLSNRPVHRAVRLPDLADAYTLPFVASEHLRTAPEALQGSLDRSRFVGSVIEYYQSVTSALMGWGTFESRHLHPTTVEMYQRLHSEAAARKEDKWQRQTQVDREQSLKAGTSILAMPTVVGESVTGSMLRLVDKIAIAQQGFVKNLDAKRDITQSFPKDPEYQYEEYRGVNASKNDQAAAYLAQVNVWGGTTDEQQMYAEAERFAAMATARQAHGIRSADDLVTPETARPIGLADGVPFASFAHKLDFSTADARLHQLVGSEFGSSPKPTRPVAREPLVGVIERDLIEKFIQQHKFQLQLCYEMALKRSESAAGSMEWRWRIDSRGQISDIALVSSSIPDARMTQCIRDKISQWRFPRPRRGSVEISYPFEFAPNRG